MEKYERNRIRSRENNRQGRKSLGIENENEDNEDNEDNQNEDNNETQMEKYERNRMRSKQNNSEGRVLLGIENESNGASENENARNEGDVDKIDELDNWVIGNYDKKVPEKETFTYYTKKDTSYIKELTGVQSKYNDLIKKWKTVVTVGDGHCLIHALFTSLLPSYRKIKYDDRGKIGKTFRHTVFANLFEGADKEFVKGNGFLEEKHLDMFVNTYKINVFVLRNVRNGKTVSFELHTVDNEMLNEFDWIAINDTLDGHFSSILMGDKFRLTSDEFIDSYDRFFEQFAKDGEFEQLKANIKENIVKLAPNDLKNSVQGYREAIGRTTEIGKLKDLIKQVESDYGLTKGEILNKYKGRMNTGNTVNPVNPLKFSKSDVFDFNNEITLIISRFKTSPRVKGKDKKVSEYKEKLENIDLQVPESIKTLTPLLKEISKEFGFKYGEFLEKTLEETKKFTGDPVNKLNSNKGRGVTRRKG